MCCLFGFLDYKHTLSAKKHQRFIHELSVAAEARGKDATGLAWFKDGQLQIAKEPLPARRFHCQLPKDVSFVMGHTRMTTQGSAKKNYNNHPFAGRTKAISFAFAHNGILYNDAELRVLHHLPKTKIETDSYAAVQLLEKRTLDLQGIGYAAEQLEGSFSFTVLEPDGIYLVKGNNPLCLMDFPQQGFYLYASTQEVLEKATRRLHLGKMFHREIPISQGDILHIDHQGMICTGRFNDEKLRYSRRYPEYFMPMASLTDPSAEHDYLEQVLSQARALHIPEEELRMLQDAGYDAFDLEEMIYDPDLRQCCMDEILCDWGCC